MQRGEGNEHRQRDRIGEQQQPGHVHQHAGGGDQALLEAVADQPADADAAHLPDGHQRDHERGLGDRVAQALFHVRDGVHVHRVDHQQREAVAERDQPERRRAQRLARSEVSRLLCLFFRNLPHLCF